MRYSLAAVAVALMACLAFAEDTKPAEKPPVRSAWQIKADLAVRKVFDEGLADKVRAIFSLTGKSTKVKEITVEPDGDGAIAKIKIGWVGSVIAIDYGMTIRWRFTKDAHISSGVESLVGIGIVTDKNKLELDDLLRTKVYPLVRAEAAK